MSIFLFAQADGLARSSASFVLLLAALAALGYLLARRYGSRRRLIRRVSELEALSAAGRAIVASELDVGALCELVATEAGSIIDNRTFQLGLFNDDVFEIQYWSVNGQRWATPATLNVGEDGGILSRVRSSGRPLLVRDFDKEQKFLPALLPDTGSTPPRSGLFVPLVSGGQTIGILVAQSAQPSRFSQRDLDLITILANQAAAGIVNAQHYEQQKRRASHLELVGQIAQRVNAINDLDEIFGEVVKLTKETFGYDSVNIFGFDRQINEIVLRASSIKELKPASIRLRPGEGLIGTAAETGLTALANNTLEDERFLGVGISTETLSEIAIPLVVDDEFLGVLDVQSVKMGVFDAQDKTVLEALAAQVAIAIHKASLFAAQREQAWMTTAQLQVAEAISQAPDMESLTETLVRITPLLVGAAETAILLWDSEANCYLGAAVFGATAEATRRFSNMALSIGDWKALDAVHVTLEPLSTSQPSPWMEEHTESSQPDDCPPVCYLFPLIAKGQILGVLVAVSEVGSREQLDEGRAELLRSIVGQAAQAIESIQLQVAQQEEAWVNTALLQVAEAVNKLTDLNEILNTIVRLVPMLVGVKNCLILIWDEEQGMFRAGPSHGLTEMGYGLLDSFEIDLSEFPRLETQDVERVGPDAAFYTLKLPHWMHAVLDTTTANAFPLNARGRLVGALIVGPSEADRALRGRRLHILSGIAQQAATAVVNHQLYKESAERSRMEQELNVARAIQASLMPERDPDIPGCTVASFWQAARQVSGDFYDFLPLPDGRWGVAIADVADKGVPAALFMALSRTILRTVAFNRQEPAETLERTNQIIFGDTSSDLFVTVFYGVWDPTTATLLYASGGHNPPVLLKQSGRTSLLETKGIALGVLERIQLDQRQVRLRPGDTVILYTDGATEAMNEDYDEFGMERLRLAARSAQHQDASGVLATITEAIYDHAGETPQFDDITLVVLKHVEMPERPEHP